MRSTTVERSQVDDDHLGPVVVVARGGRCRRPAPSGRRGQAPGEPAHRRPPQHRPVAVELGERAPGRLAHVPAVAPPPGRVGVGQAGQHVAAGRAGRARSPSARALVGLPALVAVEPPEGADVQRPVHDSQRVDVPAVGDGRALPHHAGVLAAGGDPPDGVVPARADVERRRRTSTRRGGRGRRRGAGSCARRGRRRTAARTAEVCSPGARSTRHSRPAAERRGPTWPGRRGPRARRRSGRRARRPTCRTR